jgi:hypothetical protein
MTNQPGILATAVHKPEGYPVRADRSLTNVSR